MLPLLVAMTQNAEALGAEAATNTSIINSADDDEAARTFTDGSGALHRGCLDEFPLLSHPSRVCIALRLARKVVG